jgi:chromosome segregation ATPase
MPKPTSERQALERERDELPGQIAVHQTELATTPATNKARRERLDWQIRNLQKRLAGLRNRLAVLQSEPDLGPVWGESSDE